jgi:ABC-type transport system involved in multi-copper enzyme maturation permease subunit
VSRFLAVTGLALRELWISFRLLFVMGLLLLAALPGAIVPVPGGDPLASANDHIQPFAVGLAAGLALAAGVAAGTISAERQRGTAGWLVSRAVPRATIVAGWFAAFAVVMVIGIGPAALLAWLSLGPLGEIVDPVAFAVTVAAAWGVGLAALALGLLLGSLFATLPAMLLSGAVTAALLMPAVTLGLPALVTPPAPGVPFAILADLADAARPISDSVRAGGAALAASALLLLLASAVMGRADL